MSNKYAPPNIITAPIITLTKGEIFSNPTNPDKINRLPTEKIIALITIFLSRFVIAILFSYFNKYKY